jgi:hypothetical protein
MGVEMFARTSASFVSRLSMCKVIAIRHEATKFIQTLQVCKVARTLACGVATYFPKFLGELAITLWPDSN